MTLLPMTEAEVAEVSEFLCSAYALLREREGLSQEQTEFLKTERGSPESIRRESQSQGYIVAREASRIVGVVAVSGDMITKLYVSPGHLDKGIGRSLYEAAESKIRAEGHRRVVLGAFPTAVGFYERMGLSVVGRKRPCGALAGLTLAFMEKDLSSRAS